MNKILNLSKIIMLIFLATFFTILIGGKASAETTSTIVDTNRKASLTITKYEHTNGSETNLPFKGVEFTIYEIPSDANVETAAQAENYIKNHTVNSQSATTPESGTIKFSDLNVGRYLVVETNAPTSVLQKIESFLIDLPRTNANGNGLDYDVTVYPKNVTIAGTATLTHVNENDEPLVGATWTLQRKNTNGKWANCANVGTLTTNSEGKITVENLEKGEYRFMPNTTLEGYVANKLRTIGFTIDLDNLNKSVKYTSERPKIETYVKTGNGEYVKELGVFPTDLLRLRLESNVTPDVKDMYLYKITIKAPSNMELDTDSLKVSGIDKNGTLAAVGFLRNLSTQQITINLGQNGIGGLKKIVVDLNARFKKNIVHNGEYDITSTLEVNGSIDENGNKGNDFETPINKATAYMGFIKIVNTDKDQHPLQGAKFKIATSKENAKNGTFIKDADNKDIVAVSDSEGIAIFNSLKYGEYGESHTEGETSYWVVEIEAPSSKYNLLQKPEETIINANYETSLKNIVNTEKFTLPLTGAKFNIVSVLIGTLFIFAAFVIKQRKKGKKEVEEK